MNDKIRELAIQAGLKAPYGSEHEGLADFDWRKFAELLKQAIYAEIRESLTPDELITAESNPANQAYLNACNDGLVDALYIIKTFGEERED